MSENLTALIFVANRMLDYANEIHSMPGCAVPDEDYEETFGLNWNRAVCDCTLYNGRKHPGCLGKNAKNLPPGWKSGDAPKEGK